MAEHPVVIITGASRGLGAAVACWLGKVGARIVLAARSADGLAATARAVERLGARTQTVVMDVAEPEACQATVSRTLDRFGRLDALINNAGVVEPLGPIADADPAAWNRNLAVNAMGPVYLTQAALAALRRSRGRVVNVSSGASGTPIPGAGAYCMAKAAMTHFTRVLAVEEPRIVPVAVRPGVVDTAMQTQLREKGPAAMPADTAAFYLDLKRGGMLEPPETPGRAVAWLALHAPDAWRGRFVNYDDPEIVAPAVAVFGHQL